MNKFLEISFHDNDFYNPFTATIKSLAEFIKDRYCAINSNELNISDKNLSALRYATDKLFRGFVSMYIIMGLLDPINDIEYCSVHSFKIVQENDVKRCDNYETAYIQLTGYNYGDYFFV